MKTYVIQHKKDSKTLVDICQAKSITETIKFLSKQYNNEIGHIEYIYSEEYQEEK